jgi:hypothetical protein
VTFKERRDATAERQQDSESRLPEHVRQSRARTIRRRIVGRPELPNARFSFSVLVVPAAAGNRRSRFRRGAPGSRFENRRRSSLVLNGAQPAWAAKRAPANTMVPNRQPNPKVILTPLFLAASLSQAVVHLMAFRAGLSSRSGLLFRSFWASNASRGVGGAEVGSLMRPLGSCFVSQRAAGRYLQIPPLPTRFPVYDARSWPQLAMPEPVVEST